MPQEGQSQPVIAGMLVRQQAEYHVPVMQCCPQGRPLRAPLEVQAACLLPQFQQQAVQSHPFQRAIGRRPAVPGDFPDGVRKKLKVAEMADGHHPARGCFRFAFRQRLLRARDLKVIPDLVPAHR